MLFKIIYLGLAWCSTSVFQTEIFFLCRYAFLVPLLCSCECGAVVVPFRQERSLVLVKNLNDMALGGGMFFGDMDASTNHSPCHSPGLDK